MFETIARWILRSELREHKFWYDRRMRERDEASTNWFNARREQMEDAKRADFYKTQLYREREIHLRVMQDAERTVGRRLS